LEDANRRKLDQNPTRLKTNIWNYFKYKFSYNIFSRPKLDME